MENKQLYVAVGVLLLGLVLGYALFHGKSGNGGGFFGATSTITGSNALSDTKLFNVLESLAEDTANLRAATIGSTVNSTSSLNFTMPTVWRCYNVGVTGNTCPLNISSSTTLYATSTFTGFSGLNTGDFVLLQVASTSAVVSSTLQWVANVSSTNTVNVQWFVNSLTTSSVPVNTDIYIRVLPRTAPALQVSTGTLAS